MSSVLIELRTYEKFFVLHAI